MDVALTALFIGIGLVVCGYLVGREAGVKETLQCMFDTQLLTPEQVMHHFEKLGYKKKN